MHGYPDRINNQELYDRLGHQAVFHKTKAGKQCGVEHIGLWIDKL